MAATGEPIPILKYSRLTKNAVPPTHYTPHAAGYDLYSAYAYSIDPGQKVLVTTDLHFEFPSRCYGRIADRSSMVYSHSLIVAAGVIDPDYRGNVGVLIFNLGDQRYHIQQGDKIAQMIVEKNVLPKIEEQSILSLTMRDDQGFGSSGK